MVRNKAVLRETNGLKKSFGIPMGPVSQMSVQDVAMMAYQSHGSQQGM